MSKIDELISILRSKRSLILIITIYIIVFSVFTVERYNCYLTNAWDLGVYNQAFWTTLHGKLFYETPDLPSTPGGSFLGVHFAPILFLLLPFYAIYPSPVTLLFLQTVFVALGAVPIYLISDEVLKSRGKALAFASLYLSYPVVQALNIYDFHIEAFLPFFFLSSFYCYLKGKWITYWIFIILSIITIDFAPIMIAAMSLVNILSNKEEILNLINGKNRKLEKHTLMAISTILVSAVSFPLILQASIIFSGKTSDVVTVVSGFLSPQRMGSISEEYMYLLQFWLFMICNLLFLPLFEPLFLLMSVPWFLVTILSSGMKTFHLLGYQYGGAFVAAPLFIASIYGAKRLLRENQRNWCLVFTITLSISVLMMPLNPLMENRLVGIAYEGLPRRTSHTAILDNVLRLIPENASVYTINNLFPQLSNRDNAYAYLPDDVNIEYVLADQQSVWFNDWINGRMSEILPELMSSGEYGIVAYADGVILLKRGYVGGPLIYEKTSYIYNHENLALRYGSKIYDSTSKSGTVLVHQPSDPTGTFWFGPYVSLLPGNYTATFRLKAENINTDHLLTLLVSRKLGTILLANLEVKGSEFESEMSWQNFSLNFRISQEVARGLIGPEKNLEFVGIALSSGSTIYLDYIEVSVDE